MTQKAGFREVLAVAEFRALWSAEVISVCGDQLARVALSILVYQQTSSAALTALTYALTFMPALLGAAVLAGLADRFPRRTVLVSSDLVRAALAGAMALPGLPLAVLWTLVFGLALVGAPFKAAQLALLPDVLKGEAYPVGLALRTVSTQMAQLAGFAVGGSVLLLISPTTALGVNAATFVISIVIIMRGVQPRPASRPAKTEPGPRRTTSAFHLLFRSRRLLVLVGLTMLAGLTIAPEGVAAPYAAGLGGSAIAVGVLLAADPLGSALGAWAFSRRQRSASNIRTDTITPLAIGSGAALIPCFLTPGLAVSALLWALSGALTTMFLIQAQAELTQTVPDSRRGAVIGIASAGLQASQGLVILATGLVAQQWGVYRAVGIIGLVTATLAALLGLSRRRARLRSHEDLENEHGARHGDKKITGHGSAFKAPPFPEQAVPNEVRSHE
ncbi:MFS transporter [Actinophytocola sediminis]